MNKVGVSQTNKQDIQTVLALREKMMNHVIMKHPWIVKINIFLFTLFILSCEEKDSKENKVDPVNPYANLHWQLSASNVGKAITTNPVNPNTIYVSTYAGIIFISYDRGETWRGSIPYPYDTTTHEGAGDVQFLAICPSDTNIIFAGGIHSSGLFRTSDNGKKWVNVLPGVDADAEALSFNPQNPAQVFFMSYSEADFYVSQDTGRTWQLRKSTGYERSCTIRMHPTNPNVFVAGAANGRIIKSTDQGNNWYVVQSTRPDQYMEMPAIVWDPVNTNKIYATISGRHGKTSLCQSSDAGETWRLTDPKESLWAGYMMSNGVAIFGGDISTFITSDLGKNVFKIGGDETVSGYWSITSSGNRIFVISLYPRQIFMVDL